MDISKTKLADLGTMSGINSSADNDVVLPPGKVIAERFEIIGVIGQGGMGTVYEVYDQMREEQGALRWQWLHKMISPMRPELPPVGNSASSTRPCSHLNFGESCSDKRSHFNPDGENTFEAYKTHWRQP